MNGPTRGPRGPEFGANPPPRDPYASRPQPVPRAGDPYAQGYVPRGSDIDLEAQRQEWLAMRPTRSKPLAALLTWFLGMVGGHNFYLGQHKRGVGHIALMLLSLSAQLFHVLGIHAPWILPVSAMFVTANIAWMVIEFIVIVVTPEHRLGKS